MLDLLGIPAEAQMQGKSLMPIMEGKKVDGWRTDWLYEYYEYPGWENVKPFRGIRTERYKLIHFFLSPEEFELYDLQVILVVTRPSRNSGHTDPGSIQRVLSVYRRITSTVGNANG